MLINELCLRAKKASAKLSVLPTEEKNRMLQVIADALIAHKAEILCANDLDVHQAEESGKPAQFIDRLKLTDARISGMADGILKLISLPDPVGRVLDSWENYIGLQIEKVSVPFGVIGIIYEARPNVTADSVGLCIKSGNATVLRGSKDALNSNLAIVKVMKDALSDAGFDAECIQIIPDVTREGADRMMKLNGIIDVLIPRGGAGLISSVVKNATIPVIETGTGNCHIYLEKSGDLEIAKEILLNAKLSRPSVCNAAESLVVDEEIANEALPILLNELDKNGVEVFGDSLTCEIWKKAKPATEEDFAREFLGYAISCKVVPTFREAIEHINMNSTHHSECIVTRNEVAKEAFFKEIDSACVYANASTRFTDGFEFGFGAEIGISTQKLHARGPLGLKELTSYKFVIEGNGQIRK